MDLYRLDQLGSFFETTESSRINRRNRQRTVSFTIICSKENPQILLDKLWTVLKQQRLPPGYSFSPSSTLIEKQDFYMRLWSLFILTIILIFFLLSIEKESISQAILILLPLPLILCFPVIMIKLTGQSIGTATILGLILLAGMGINNGILILDNIDYSQRICLKTISSAVQGRLDGLILTTATSIGGIFPLVFTNEIFFVNLGLVLISGLAGSLIVSLFIFPGLLLFFGRGHKDSVTTR
jgi:multidrug efflux pump subunit AcrB